MRRSAVLAVYSNTGMAAWNFDFGVCKDAAALRKKKVSYSFPSGTSDAEQKATLENIEAAREAAAVLLESPSFADRPVAVYASGQAEERHEPRFVEETDHEVQLRGGKLEKKKHVLASVEQTTITITQQPPKD